MAEGVEQVRRVIQDRRTGWFLTRANGWSADQREAWELPNIVTALRLARELGLKQASLVLKFSDGKYDVRLDL